MSENKWYILNVVAGQEFNVQKAIKELIDSGDKDVKDVFVPVRKVSRLSRGKKVESEQKMFPNYVYVNLNMNKGSYARVRDINKVLRFLDVSVVGDNVRGGVVEDSEITRIKNKLEQQNDTNGNIYEVGDIVKIIDGPFESFTGTVEVVDLEKNLLSVSVSIFGRENKVDIAVDKVDKV